LTFRGSRNIGIWLNQFIHRITDDQIQGDAFFNGPVVTGYSVRNAGDPVFDILRNEPLSNG